MAQPLLPSPALYKAISQHREWLFEEHGGTPVLCHRGQLAKDSQTDEGTRTGSIWEWSFLALNQVKTL